jgi:hypothetical protein
MKSKSELMRFDNQSRAVALKGMISLPDTSGTNIDVQILIQLKLIGQNLISSAKTDDRHFNSYGLCFGEQACRN